MYNIYNKYWINFQCKTYFFYTIKFYVTSNADIPYSKIIREILIPMFLLSNSILPEINIKIANINGNFLF